MLDTEVQESTARALLALSSEWIVLDDVGWPGRKPADIDHVVVGPGGVFVVVAGRTGKSAAAACRSAAAVLARGARLSRGTVRSVLCTAEPQPDDLGADVLRCTPDTIVELLLSQGQVLERAELGTASASVTSQVRLDRGPRRSLTGGSSRRDTSPGSTGRLALFLLLVAVTVAAAPWAAERLESARAQDPPLVPSLGETVRIAGTAVHPPLDLTVEQVQEDGPAYVVQLTVRNDGTRPFDLGDLDLDVELDNLHEADAIDRRQAELAGTELEPGMERAVTYRFDVPPKRSAEVVHVVVGDRRTDRARWQAP